MNIPHKHKMFIGFLICLSILLARSLEVLLHAQFFGEDAAIFYASAHNDGYESLTESYQGYLHTIQRIVALISTYFIIDIAPYIFNAAAFFLNGLPLYLIFSNRTNNVLGQYHEKLAFALLYSLVPVNSFLLTNLTNIQWFLPTWVILFLFAEKSKFRVIQILEFVFLFLVSVTGPFSLFIILVYSIFILMKKIKVDYTKYIIIFFGSIIQGITILTNPEPHNEPTTFFKLITQPFDMIGKSFMVALSGFSFQINLAYFLKEYSYILSFLFLIISIYTIFKIYKSKNNLIMFIFMVGLLIVISVGVRYGGTYSNFNIELKVRYMLMLTFSFILSIFYLAYNYRSPLYILFSICCVVIALPIDFSHANPYKANWHKNLLAKYYPTKEGEMVEISTHHLSKPLHIIKKPTGNYPNNLQKLFLKKEVLYKRSINYDDLDDYKFDSLISDTVEFKSKITTLRDYSPYIEVTGDIFIKKENINEFKNAFLKIENQSRHYILETIPIFDNQYEVNTYKKINFYSIGSYNIKMDEYKIIIIGNIGNNVYKYNTGVILNTKNR